MAETPAYKRVEEPRRPLLTTADALDFAADQLARMANDQEMIALIGNIIKEKDSATLRDAPDAVRAALVEPERQVQAMRSASRIVRELATEHKVLALREADNRRERNPRS